MTTYHLDVWCSRGGVSRDASRHDTVLAESLDEAMELFKSGMAFLLRHYDTVQASIMEVQDDGSEKLVSRDTAYKPMGNLITY